MKPIELITLTLPAEPLRMPLVARVPPIDGLDVAEVSMDVFDQWAETAPMELPK